MDQEEEFEGYHTDAELDLISKWDFTDALVCFEYIKERWAYADCGGWVQTYKFDNLFKKHVVCYDLRTSGWSGNEDLVNALVKNHMFDCLFHTKWERGGRWCFEVDLEPLGYKLVSTVAKERKVTRQYIHKIHNQFDWVKFGKRTMLIREKSNR